MALPRNKNFSDYDNYITDQNPTTSAQAQDYFRNQAELLKAVIDCDFWQPETVYQPGDVVKSDSMPNGTEAVMVATKASVTSNVEPQWGEVGGANISDGACFWKLRWQHWSKVIATQAEAKEGIVTDKTVTPFLAGITAKTRVNIGMDDIVNYSGVSKSEFTWAVIQSVLKQKAADFNMPVVTTSEWVSGDVYPLLEKPSYHGYMSIKCYANGTMIMTHRAHSIGVNKEYIASYLDGTLSGWKELASVDTLPVGAILPYAGNTASLPNGFLFCDGSAISRTTYKELFSKIDTNYGAGNGSTTFNIPNLENNSFMEFQAERGVVKSAGLPDIVGGVSEFRFKTSASPTCSGAFFEGSSSGDMYLAKAETAYSSKSSSVYFSAKNSNAIYGNSTTVQPKSVTVRAIIKYA